MKTLRNLFDIFNGKNAGKSIDVISDDQMLEICGGRPESAVDTKGYWWINEIPSTGLKMEEMAS